MRGSIWLVTLGIILGLVGAMVLAGETQYAADRAIPPTHFGALIAIIAGALFSTGVLVEFFQIGTAIRKIADKA